MWNDARLDDPFISVDKRLDDLSSKMDSGFARVDSEIAGLRTEVRDLRHLMFMPL